MDARAIDMTNEELARVILCLLVEEMLKRRLAGIRDDLPAQPVEGSGEEKTPLALSSKAG